MSFDNLPTELKIEVFCKLYLPELPAMAMVSKKQNSVIQHEDFWRKKLELDFGFFKTKDNKSYRDYYHYSLVFLDLLKQRPVYPPLDEHSISFLGLISSTVKITPEFMFYVAKVLLHKLINNMPNASFTLIDLITNIKNLQKMYHEACEVEVTMYKFGFKFRDSKLDCIPELTRQMVNYVVDDRNFFICRIADNFDLLHFFEFLRGKGFSKQMETLFQKIIHDSDYIISMFKDEEDLEHFQEILTAGEFLHENCLFQNNKNKILEEVKEKNQNKWQHESSSARQFP